MTDYIIWPNELLRPSRIGVNPTPFTRSGGRSLNGVEPVTKTDNGWWKIDMVEVHLYNQNTRRVWNAIRSNLNGRSGLVVVPAHSFDSAPYGDYSQLFKATFDDDSIFSDSAVFTENTIFIKTTETVPIGATVIELEIEYAGFDLSGSRFSFDHALYEIGTPIDINDSIWTVTVSPSIRKEIPAESVLEFDNPTCLCRLAEDNSMDVSLSYGNYDKPNVSFTEATDFWSNLAAGLIEDPFLG